MKKVENWKLSGFALFKVHIQNIYEEDETEFDSPWAWIIVVNPTNSSSLLNPPCLLLCMNNIRGSEHTSKRVFLDNLWGLDNDEEWESEKERRTKKGEKWKAEGFQILVVFCVPFERKII